MSAINVAPFRDFAELQNVAAANELRVSRTILRIAGEKMAKTREYLEDPSRRPGESLKDDPAYLIGFVNGIKYVLSLPGMAREIMDAVTKEG